MYSRSVTFVAFSDGKPVSTFPENALPHGRERGKAAFEIADQVVDVLEPDVETHRRSAGRPSGRGADPGAVEGNGEAFESAPRCADAEQAELVEESVHRRVRNRLEHHAEQTAGLGNMTATIRIFRGAFERGVEDPV